MADLRLGASQVICNSGTTQANVLFTGPEGSLTHDRERQTIRLHDGRTPGGKEFGTAAYRSVATALDSSNANNLVPVSLVLPFFQAFQDAILPWHGLEASIPDGWQLCDGTNGTPDLRGSFLIGGGIGSDGMGTYIPGVSGGASSATTTSDGLHSHTAVTDSAGSHQHIGNTEINGSHGHTGSTASSGGHSHTVTNIAASVPHSHTITVNSGGSHTHTGTGTTTFDGSHYHNAQSNTGGSADDTIWLDTAAPGGLRAYWPSGSVGTPVYNAGTNPNAINIASAIHDHQTGTPRNPSTLASEPTHDHNVTISAASDGAHTHTASTDLGTSTSHTHTGSTDTQGAHTHVVTADPAGEHLHNYTTSFEAAHVHNITATSFAGAHTHTVSTLPPYYALCFIKYVGI